MKKLLSVFTVTFFMIFTVWASRDNPGSNHCQTRSQQQDVVTIFPWFEDFEEGNIPAGWSQTSNDGYLWDITEGSEEGIPETAYSGNFNAYFIADDGESAKLITPEFQLSGLVEPKLIFWHAQESWDATPDFLRVLYREGTTGSWTVLAVYSDAASEWTEREISLALLPTHTTVQFAFEATSYYAYGVCIDDVIITGKTCTRPTNLVITNLAPTSLDFSWTPGENETQWEFSYRKINEEIWSQRIYLNNPVYSYPANSLEPNTTYTVNIRSICSEGDTSLNNYFNFTTACDIQLPIFEDFDKVYDEGEFPLCWITYTNSPEDVYFEVNAGEYLSPPNCLYMDNDGISRPDIMLISPLLPGPVNTLRVRFKANSNNYSDQTLDVGYLDVTNDPGSFRSVRKLASPGEWTEHTVTFGDVPAHAKQIVFKHLSNGNTNTGVWIDDILIEQNPSCADIAGDSLRFGDITGTTISVSWVEPEDATEYEIRYRPEGSDTWTTELYSDNPHLLIGLSPTTRYEISVRSSCDDGQGAWTIPTRVWTAVELPYTQYFDSFIADDGWFVAQSENSDGSRYVNTNRAHYVTGSRSVYLRNGTREGEKFYYVAPKIDPQTDMQTVQMSFKAKANTVGLNLGVGVMDMGDINSFTLVESVPLSMGWNDYIVYFNHYEGQHYNIAFGHNQNARSTNIYLDNVEIKTIEDPNCLKIANVIMKNPKGDGFTLQWSNTDAAPYTIEYTNVTTGETNSVETYEIPYTFSGLTPNTNYTIRVKGDCEPEKWSEAITVNTGNIPAGIPFMESFDNSPEWYFANGTQSNKWIIGNSSNANDNDGTHCLYISHNNADYEYAAGTSRVYAYKPVHFTEVADYSIEYDWKNQGRSASNGSLQVWLVPAEVELTSGGSDPVTRNWINLYGNSNLWRQTTWQHNRFLVQIDEPGVYNLVFYWYSSGSSPTNPPAAVDSIKVTKLNCRRVTEVKVLEIHQDEAAIGFKAPEEGSSLKLHYKESNLTDWTEVRTIDIVDPSMDTSYVVEGLRPGTSYDFYIETVCVVGDDEMVSSPTDIQTFRTRCVTAGIPWMENFDTVPAPFFPHQCWDKKKYFFTPNREMLTYLMAEDREWHDRSTYGNRAAAVELIGTFGSWLMAPVVEMEADQDYYLQFDLKLLNERNGSPSSLGNNKFIVLLSDDGGNSWDPSTAIVWSNDANSDYQFADLNEQPRTFTIPLEDLSGHIRISFYVESRVEANEFDILYLDNISVDKCARPVDLVITAITDSSARIEWTSAGENPTRWEWVTVPAGTDPEEGQSMSGPENYTELTGLSPNTVYDFYVWGFCSDQDQSTRVKKSFNTICSPVEEFPYAESFDDISETKDCWEIVNHNDDEDTWTLVRRNGKNVMRYTALGNWGHDDDYLISPPLLLTGNEMVTYKVRSSIARQAVNYEVLLSANGPGIEAFNTVLLAETPRFTADSLREIRLENYSGVHHIAFHIPPGSVSADSIFISEISIELIPTCERPSSLIYTTVSQNQVELNWTENGEADEWEIEYGPVDFLPGTGTKINTTLKPHPVNGLPSSQLYEFYVRSVCGVQDTSLRSDKGFFYTSCDVIIDFPYSEGFESGGYIPSCWSQEFMSGSVQWTFRNGAHSNGTPRRAHTGDYNAYLYRNTAGNNVTRLVSPVFDLSSMDNPYLIFWHAQSQWGNGQDSLKVYYQNFGSGTWRLLKSYTNSIPDWQKDSIILPNPTSTYRLAFEGYPRYGHGVVIDDIYIADALLPAPGCEGPVKIWAEYITQTTAEVKWDSEQGDHWRFEYRLEGHDTYTGYDCNTPGYRLTGLQPDTLYHIRVKTICDDGSGSLYKDSVFRTYSEDIIFHQVTAAMDGRYGNMTPPPGTYPVKEGDSIRFEFSVESLSYWIEVTVNGRLLPVDGRTSYTFYNVHGDSTLHLTVTTGIDEYGMENSVVVYPNPARDLIHINSDEIFNSIEVYNMLGQSMYRNTILAMPLVLDISGYRQGIYFIRLNHAKGMVTKKFIKE